MVFRPRRMGGGFSRGVKFGGGVRKSSVGSIGNGTNFGGQTSVGNNSVSGNSSSCGQVASVPVFSQSKKTGGGVSTGLPQRKKWGFYDALVGQRHQSTIDNKTKLSDTAKNNKIKLRFVEGDSKTKGVEVKFDHRHKRKNRYKVVVGEDFKEKYAHKLGRANREIAKAINREIVRDARKGGVAKKVGGLKLVGTSSQRKSVKTISGDRGFQKKIQGNFAGTLGSKKSSRRNVEIDVNYRKTV